ncbi:nucleotidyl transferase AbiEii/AbiGii toxin family protein [Planktothrix sp. FACHB-1355]|uniref:Nucleotidyl transferase AbiEii/AbiGii toxin family protein n=1 Tax=Aerosakkonema funiforme FACHB-1375 TaxID=2949571 RepID=A0A926VG96_9CYAN|nr:MULTISPECIES: nucleotidyl transferase AbiEii/AbiGii toxin family protein [Oscillatoriales]MBD2182099.1 nucleotidyl transferase AbiEii/AbiGii toxin family protein [Aerosakkonema funiforme FACHB-1375]MBD3560178.1 nucleotidyl transferase AbiEii/AbiGii toxin family protein [Planktothrix sp. FACHB-1355]
MSQNQATKVAVSVQQKLRNQATQQKVALNALQTRYARERLLYRLSKSAYRDRFVLKGATLFSAWLDKPHRPTQDIDLLGLTDNTVADVEQVFREICCLEVEEDGLEFKKDTVRGQRIKEGAAYEGVRIHLDAYFAGTRSRFTLQIDIGFEDKVTPEPEVIELSTILNFPAPILKTYPRETFVAEKFEAMVMLGMFNSRLKDFYDLWFLAQEFEFEGELLGRAIKTTFTWRKTPIPLETPTALSSEFYEDSQKQKDWKGLLNKLSETEKIKSLKEVTDLLKSFLMPPTIAVAKGETFDKLWIPSGAWQNPEQAKTSNPPKPHKRLS